MSRSIATPTRRRFVQTATAAGAATTFGVPLLAKGGSKYTLKFATLAPVGSSWEKAFKSVARAVSQRTDGAVSIKIYAGGTMGDESAMVRKMRTGQLDGAAVTSVGLGDINKQLLMLQLPLLFRNYDELDKVRNAMKPTFDQLLLDGGFYSQGNGDVGFGYIFSNTEVTTPSDAKATKMWVWDSDPVSKETMKLAGINAVPLGVPDVLPSLQTGVIDAFVNSPYGAIALQWYSKAKYITNLKLAMSIGGSVLRAKTWDKIEPEYQAVMTEISHDTHLKLLKRIRRDNQKAVETLKDKGITVVQPKDMGAWLDLAEKVRKNLTGSVFEEKLVAQMMDALKA